LEEARRWKELKPVAFDIEDVGFGLLAQTKAGLTHGFYRISPDVGAPRQTPSALTYSLSVHG
jgi:hypothetical protein